MCVCVCVCVCVCMCVCVCACLCVSVCWLCYSVWALCSFCLCTRSRSWDLPKKSLFPSIGLLFSSIFKLVLCFTYLVCESVGCASIGPNILIHQEEFDGLKFTKGTFKISFNSITNDIQCGFIVFSSSSLLI